MMFVYSLRLEFFGEHQARLRYEKTPRGRRWLSWAPHRQEVVIPGVVRAC